MSCGPRFCGNGTDTVITLRLINSLRALKNGAPERSQRSHTRSHGTQPSPQLPKAETL